ncbi:MAG: hypothetical protein V3V14_08885 [Saprospiraceae bacterium]
MKAIIFSLMFLGLLTGLKGQGEFSIGLSPTYSSGDGIGVGLQLEKLLTNKDGIKLSFVVSNRMKKVKLGYQRILAKSKRFTLLSGLDLGYLHSDYTRFGRGTYKRLSLSLPIDIRFNLSQRFSINMGLNFHLKELYDHSTVAPNYKNYYDIEDIRIGGFYKF